MPCFPKYHEDFSGSSSSTPLAALGAPPRGFLSVLDPASNTLVSPTRITFPFPESPWLFTMEAKEFASLIHTQNTALHLLLDNWLVKPCPENVVLSCHLAVSPQGSSRPIPPGFLW